MTWRSSGHSPRENESCSPGCCCIDKAGQHWLFIHVMWRVFDQSQSHILYRDITRMVLCICICIRKRLVHSSIILMLVQHCLHVNIEALERFLLQQCSSKCHAIHSIVLVCCLNVSRPVYNRDGSVALCWGHVPLSDPAYPGNFCQWLGSWHCRLFGCVDLPTQNIRSKKICTSLSHLSSSWHVVFIIKCLRTVVMDGLAELSWWLMSHEA